MVGVTTFGFSASYKDVYAKTGITATAVAAKGSKMIQYYSQGGGQGGGGQGGHPVPTLFVNAPIY